MSRTRLANHYQRIAALWPKEPLRPDRPFTRIPTHRLQQLEASSDAAAQSSELRNINALYSLLDDRYAKKYPTPKHVLAPQSNPTHYSDLMAELERAPTRGWWQNLVAGLRGRVRFS